jgi:hypothetical protein
MRRVIIATMHRQASEAVRLRLEQHLAVCAGCRAEKSRWLLVEHLEEQAPRYLSSAVRERILDHLTALPEAPMVRVGKAPRRLPLLWGAGAVAAVALALLVVLPRHRDDGRTLETGAVSGTQGLAPEERAVTVRAQTAGTIDSGGAHIVYGAQADFRLRPGERQVELFAGEIDIEVTPGGPGRFRVHAPRFTVEVLGTHFVVGLDRVETFHGLVRVVEPVADGGREIARVPARHVWRLHDLHASATLEPLGVPTAPAAPGLVPRPGLPSTDSADSLPTARVHRVDLVAGAESAPVAEAPLVAMRGHSAGRAVSRAEADEDQAEQPAQGDRVASGAVAGPGGIAGGRLTDRVPPSAERLLADARSALSRGATRRARECVARALRAAPRARQRAVAELLSADALLVESRYAAALAAYRRTMDVFQKYPEGETAAFALAQLLSERGPQEQARAALERYLARYPDGRFAEEVGKKLANTP